VTPAADSRRYGIVVGQFLNEERANSEQTRLAEATGLTGRVVSADDAGTQVFRVILGSFASRSAAESKGDELIAKGQVNEARVTALPR
jgi:cell division protein FtsN